MSLLSAPSVPRDRRSKRFGVCCLALLILAGCGPRALVPGRPLTIAFHSAPQSLDPHLHDEASTHSILGHIYDTLIAFNGDARLQPALAESWENPDDLTWRFQLRPGVVFHDGRPLEAADVVASLERARSVPRGMAAGYVIEVAQVRALDTRSVEIVTRRPYPILLNKLAFVAIVPRDAPARIEHPIGTGPYQFVSYTPGVVMDLEAFPRRWRAPDIEPQLRLLFVSDVAERLAKLLSGDADVATDLPVADIARVSESKCCTVRSRGGLGVAYLQLPVDRKPWSDLRVRRAVSLALDREALARRVLGGQGSAAGQMVPPQVFGFAPDIVPPARDVQAARRLLAEAGYPQGLDLDVEFRAGPNLAELRGELAEAGIRCRLVPRSWSELYPRLVAGQAAGYYGGWQCPSGDASDLLDQKVHSKGGPEGYGASNFNGYSNPRLDQLIEQSAATLDMVERRRKLEAAMHVLSDDLGLVPLMVVGNVYGVRRDLEWQPRVDARVCAWEMRRRGK